MTQDEFANVVSLHRLSGKKYKTCHFVLKYCHGDFKKACDLLGVEPVEDGRSS